MVRDLRGTVVAHLPDRSGSPRRPVSSTSPSTRKRLALLGCHRLDADQRSWVLGTISSRGAWAVASDKRDDGITQKILRAPVGAAAKLAVRETNADVRRLCSSALLIRGFGAEESKAAFIRARELAAAIEDATERFAIYYGLWLVLRSVAWQHVARRVGVRAGDCRNIFARGWTRSADDGVWVWPPTKGYWHRELGTLEATSFRNYAHCNHRRAAAEGTEFRAARGALAGEAPSLNGSTRRRPCRARICAQGLFADPGISRDRGSANASHRADVMSQSNESATSEYCTTRLSWSRLVGSGYGGEAGDSATCRRSRP
jgi:hypothetical protein